MTNTKRSPNILPFIPLRDLVVFPGTMATLFIGRDLSRKALLNSGKHKQLVLALQKNSDERTPESIDDIHTVGVTVKVIQTLTLPDGVIKILFEGIKRVSISELSVNEEGFLEAHVRSRQYSRVSSEEALALRKVFLDSIKSFESVAKKMPEQLLESLDDIENPHLLLDTVVTHCGLSIDHTQELLEISNLAERYEFFLCRLEEAHTRLSLEEKIKDRIKNHINKSQREYYLQEQMKAIQKELGDHKTPEDEAQKFLEQAEKANLPEHVLARVKSEVQKMRTMNPMTAEASVVRSYLEWILALPWNYVPQKKVNLKSCINTLDEQHHGLVKVKERIIEYLSVQTRITMAKGQILCLVGPPGVGKTSLARSIADAIERPFVRCALGGVHDEGEIRGHRRTYIGSMPGKIIQNMRRAATLSPVFLLDEIDKLGHDWRGDPSSALLEILDHEQNTKFNDHYIELDYNLSHVLFIATANSMNIPPALLDRMDVIHIEGYTEIEKAAIAEKHLIPKVLKENGVEPKECLIDKKVIPDIIQKYTQEAGVRQLTREISKIARKSLCKILQDKVKSCKITSKNLEQFLGVRKIIPDEHLTHMPPGACKGLSWSSVGGNVMLIESTMYPGKGKIHITGHLGRVMSESAQIALSLSQCYSQKHSVNKHMFSDYDFHVHVPDGAVPKDGPSAGIAITTALVSLITQTPVHANLAMTGEVTLQGRVQPIGGLKDKLLAARRMDLKRVLVPQNNEKDLIDLPKEITEDLEIILVSHMDEVLKIALVQPIMGIPSSPSYRAPFTAS